MSQNQTSSKRPPKKRRSLIERIRLKFYHPTFEEWIADLHAIEDVNDQKAFIFDTLRHKANLHIFGKFFFPHIIKGEYETPRAHLELIEFLSNRRTGAAIFPRGFAKAQPLDSKIMTPTGWTTMGELKVGDIITGGDGKATRVKVLHPVAKMPIYEIETRDGRKTRCNEAHLWKVYCPSNWGREPRVVPLSYMLGKYRCDRLDKRDGKKGVEYRFFLPSHGPIEMKEEKLEIDPYVLGVWLGDGNSADGAITAVSDDAKHYASKFPVELHKQKTKYRYNIVGLKPLLRSIGVLNNKHIPNDYLHASINQRQELLRGLLDTDGCVNSASKGRIAEFSNQNESLIQGVVQLARSLGGRATISRGMNKQHGREIPNAKVLLHMPEGQNPFSLPRKSKRWRPARTTRVAITSIKKVEDCHARCITVENPEGLYITDDFILTHNSSWEKIDTMHDIVYALEPVILFISATVNDAEFHFDSIKMELEGNEWLREVYGNLVPEVRAPGTKWTNTHLRTNNGVDLLARGSGKGRGVNVRNQRPTKVVIDDAEFDEMVHSDVRRQKFWRWLTEVIIPSLDKERGFLKMIGTVIHPDAAVLRFYKENGGIFRKAIEGGRSIWEEFWTLDDLHRVRDGYVDEDGRQHAGIGLRAFSQEYLNTPINDETSIFKQGWLDAHTYEELPEGWRAAFDIVMAIDPAAGESEMADFYGLAILGRDRRDGRIYVIEAQHFDGKFKGQIKKALIWATLMYLKWQPRIVGIEVILNQTAFFQVALEGVDFTDKRVLDAAEEIMAKGRRMPRYTTQELREMGVVRMPIKKVTPEGKDKVNRAQHHEAKVEQGLVLFHPSHTTFYDEMIEFPNSGHDDIVDAFLYACSLLRVSRGKMSKKRSPGITAGLRKKQF